MRNSASRRSLASELADWRPLFSSSPAKRARHNSLARSFVRSFVVRSLVRSFVRLFARQLARARAARRAFARSLASSPARWPASLALPRQANQKAISARKLATLCPSSPSRRLLRPQAARSALCQPAEPATRASIYLSISRRN